MMGVGNNSFFGESRPYMKLIASSGAMVTLIAACSFFSVAHAESPCRPITGEPTPMEQSKAIEGSKSYVYRTVDNTELRLNIFLPQDFRPSDKRSAIIFFFGGAWIGGTVEQFVPQARYLAKRGMVTGVANYRVLCRNSSTPFDSAEDAREAIRWMRSHASELGIDPSRIAAAGGSAGGHVALSSAIFGSSSVADDPIQVDAKPNALVLFNPAINLTDGVIKQIIQESFGDAITDRIEGISPLQHVHKGLPPTIILNGKADKTTPYATAKAYCKLAVASGSKCRVVGYEGADHGFFNSPQFAISSSNGGKWYRPTLLEADRFLTRIGYLQRPSPSEIP